MLMSVCLCYKTIYGHAQKLTISQLSQTRDKWNVWNLSLPHHFCLPVVLIPVPRLLVRLPFILEIRDRPKFGFGFGAECRPKCGFGLDSASAEVVTGNFRFGRIECLTAECIRPNVYEDVFVKTAGLRHSLCQSAVIDTWQPLCSMYS